MRIDRAPIPLLGAVMVVDDSAYARTRLKRFLVDWGFSMVVEAANGDEALAAFSEFRPRLVLVDQVMRGRSGTETARLLMAREPQVDVIMLTVVTDCCVHQEALHAGVRRVLQKADYDGLATALRELGHE